MVFVTLKITACGYAFCAAEIAGKLIRNLSENLPVEGACPRLWCRAVFGVELDLVQVGAEKERKKGLHSV